MEFGDELYDLEIELKSKDPELLEKILTERREKVSIKQERRENRLRRGMITLHCLALLAAFCAIFLHFIPNPILLYIFFGLSSIFLTRSIVQIVDFKLTDSECHYACKKDEKKIKKILEKINSTSLDKTNQKEIKIRKNNTRLIENKISKSNNKIKKQNIHEEETNDLNLN